MIILLTIAMIPALYTNSIMAVIYQNVKECSQDLPSQIHSQSGDPVTENVDYQQLCNILVDRGMDTENVTNGFDLCYNSIGIKSIEQRSLICNQLNPPE